MDDLAKTLELAHIYSPEHARLADNIHEGQW